MTAPTSTTCHREARRRPSSFEAVLPNHSFLDARGRRRRADDLGSALVLFIAGVVPILFLCFALTLDLNQAIHVRQLSEQAINDAALYSYRYLPFNEAAKAGAQAFLRTYGTITEGAEVSVHDGLVEVSLDREIPLPFLSHFVPGASLTSHRFARVRGTPFDMVIALDRSGYMAPEMGAALWGNEVDWPAFTHPIPLAGPSQCFLAQQCFNPVFSRLKRAAIRAFHHMSGFPMNSVGVAVFPGRNAFLDVVRGPALGGEQAEQVSFIDDDVEWGGTHFCAASADNEGLNVQYAFPAQDGSAPQVAWPGRNEEVRITTPSGTYNPAHDSMLTVREVLWSQVAKRIGEPALALPDTAQVLAGITELLAAPPTALRRGLTDRVIRKVLILAGDVPYVAGVRFGSDDRVAEALSEAFGILHGLVGTSPGPHLRLYYLLLPSPSAVVSQELRNDLDHFFESQGRKHQNLKVTLVMPEEPLETALSTILLDRRAAVLSCTGGKEDCEDIW